MIEELIALARDMREADRRGEVLGLTEEELAFYDALETNLPAPQSEAARQAGDSAVKVLGEPTLKEIARELVETVRRNVTIDWTERENVRAQLRRLVKRVLRKHGYPSRQAGVSHTDRPRAGGALRGGVGGCVEGASNNRLQRTGRERPAGEPERLAVEGRGEAFMSVQKSPCSI